MATVDAVKKLVGPDNQELYWLFIESYLSLLLDGPLAGSRPIKVLRSFYRRLVSSAPKELINDLASYADRIMQSLAYSSELTETGEFVEEMKSTPVFKEYLHFYRTKDPVYLQYVLTFLLFGKKMDYVDPSLEKAAFRSWLEVEQEMNTLELDSEILQSLRKIISHWLKDFDDTLFLPKHGPGFTAEGLLDPNRKLDNLRFHPRDRFVFRRYSFGRVDLDRGAIEKYPVDKGAKVARLKFVPKDTRTMRSICMEPVSRMYLQQEVARWLIRAMERSSCRYLVDLNDQTPNQRYAVMGSYNYTLDTIDLSAASDRVHIDLVKAVFPNKVLIYLLGTRTDLVDTQSKHGIVRIKKFAPMGSALCFPVQTIIFAAITVLAHLMHHNKEMRKGDQSGDWFTTRDVDDVIRRTGSESEQQYHTLFTPRIFGDDIICDNRITDDVLALLERTGLRINREKSFCGGQSFRESCGVYAYDGHVVTPFRFKVPSHRGFNVSAFASTIDHANRAGDFGFRHLRSKLINHLLETRPNGVKGAFKHLIPFTERREQFGIYTDRLQLGNAETRVSPDPADKTKPSFQRPERRVLCLKPRKSEEKISRYMEDYAYDQWVRARTRGGSAENNYSAPRVRPSTTRISRGWTPY